MKNYFKLLFWMNMWGITWLITRPFRKEGTHNCITWAFDKWENEGGYVVVRWCRNSKYFYLKWPHFLWLSSENHEDLISAQSPIQMERTVPLLWFNPIIESGDMKKNHDE